MVATTLDDIEYEIIQMANSGFKIFKFKGGFQDSEYDLIQKHGKTKYSCNCISGRIRKTCKHSDWIRAIIDGSTRELPSNVKITKRVDITTQKQEVKRLLKRVASKRIVKAKSRVK